MSGVSAGEGGDRGEDLALEAQRHKVTNYLALSPTGRGKGLVFTQV